MKKPTIGPIQADEAIIITPYPNGGVTVEQAVDGSGFRPAPLGAYTSMNDALDALREPEAEQ